MNILLVNHYAGSLDMGMEFRPFYFAKEWEKFGHTVTIICGDYSHLRKSNPVVDEDFTEKNIDNVKYVFVKTGRYRGNGINRVISMFKFVFKLWKNAKMIADKYKPDVVIASSTYPLDTYACQKIKKYAKCKLIHEIHDMWPATLVEIGGMSRFNPFVILMQLAENSFCKNSDKIISIPPLSKDYLVSHGMKPEKFSYINNGVVLSDWENPKELPNDIEEKLINIKKNKFIVGYFGGHALSNNLNLILDTAKVTKNDNIHYVFIGDGSEKSKLISRVCDEKISNVTFLDSIDKLSIPKLNKYFDTLIIASIPSRLYRFGVSMNKLFDYMMLKKPIVMCIDTPYSIIEDNKIGYKITSYDPIEISSKIAELYNMNSDARDKFGENAYKLVKTQYSYDILAKRFIEAIESVI